MSVPLRLAVYLLGGMDFTKVQFVLGREISHDASLFVRVSGMLIGDADEL